MTIESSYIGSQSSESVYKLLEEVFESSILEADLTDPIDNLIQLYESFSSQGFESSFKQLLMLTVNEAKRSSDVLKIFRFISEFAVSLDNKFKNEHVKNKPKSDNDGNEDSDDDEDFVHPFLKHVFAVLQEWSRAPSYIIRFRSCQLLYKILTRILDIGAGEIDINTYDRVANLIQIRRKDVSATVRAHAVLLAKFFQDPSDHNDPVIAALCWQMESDPNPRVRQNIVDIIAACEETIIPITRRFLHDKNSLVRNSALLHICNRISPRSYTTQHRILILNQCFNDSAAIVRRNAEHKLIPIWFRGYGDKLSVFIKSLRLGNDCMDKLPFSRTLIYFLFKLVKISQILDELDLNPETALPKFLNGEKIFIWRHFYLMAYRQEKLKKFIPEDGKLIEFIIKSFTESAFDEAYAYNELISFTMDIIDILGEDKCEKLPPLAVDIMKNIFTPRDVIPYAVTFYCEYAAKETKDIHGDLLQTVNDLMAFIEIASGEEQKKLILKCLDIYSETLAQDNISAYVELMAIKDELVLTYLESEDLDIKAGAFRALSLYCLLDLEEARQFWPFIEKTIYDSPDALKLNVMKGALDIFKCYGCKIFGDECGKTVQEFEEALENLFSHAEDADMDMQIVLEGFLKLYLSHHTFSPILMAKLILLMFHPDDGHLFKNDTVNFLELYNESSQEAECLTKSFLTIINMLFDAERSSPYYKVNIKTVVLQLLEFANLFEDNKNFEVEEKLKEIIPVKLTKKFLKKQWRISSLDLQDICEQSLPQNTKGLLKLKSNVKLIIESLESPIIQQKNPYTKKSMKFFMNYLKKIQSAIDTMPDEVNNIVRLSSTPSREFMAKVVREEVAPLLEDKDRSY